jgi:cysteine desulfurase / selenocysteine lyase
VLLGRDKYMKKRAFDLEQIRQDFPVIATRLVHDKPLVYLDSGATAQKPQCVIDAVSHFYAHNNANINRGVHELAEQTTLAYEESRRCVSEFIGSESPEQIVFTSGTTESINLVAHGLGAGHIQAGDEIVLTQMEHHANIVPWQQLCERVGAVIKVAPLTQDGELDFSAFSALLSEKTKLVAVIHVSNVMGCVTPVEAIVELARSRGIATLIDGAQAVAHVPVDVSRLGCDFYVFSAHKLYGPTGVGVLYAKAHWLEVMPPYQTGGDMIRRVSFEKTTFNKAPHKFEAGTPNIAGVIGFAQAIRYFQQFEWADKLAHEQALVAYLDEGLRSLTGLRVFGPAPDKRKALVSFVLDHVHAHDIGSFLDNEGIAVRVGHHCAMPLMQHLGLAATTRASLGLYSSKEDIDALLSGLDKARSFFLRGS